MDLHRALEDISTIRGQMARGTMFQGYGPAALTATGALATLAAVIQSAWLTDPAGSITAYLTLWIGTAVISAAIVGIEAVRRSRRVHSGLADDMIQAAIGQFLPSMVAGALLTFVIVRFIPQALWMLPGLWQILFSIGVFASCASLPRPLIAVGVWYLGTGLACLVLAADAQSLSPWSMGLSFGFGQLLAAILVHLSFRGHDGES
jgi:hypothetical protein